MLSRRTYVRAFFLQNFPHTRRLAKVVNDEAAALPVLANMNVPPQRVHTVGTAFDYRLRFFLRRFDVLDTVAFRGLRILAMCLSPKSQAQRVDKRLKSWTVAGRLSDAQLRRLPQRVRTLVRVFDLAARELSERRAKGEVSGRLEDRVNTACLVLAYAEQFRRRSFPVDRSPLGSAVRRLKRVDQVWNAIAEEDLLRDMAILSRASWPLIYSLRETHLILNPTFSGSHWVDGADADLVADDLLLELKTSRQPRPVRRPDIWQLLGYCLLDADDEFRIRRVGFLLPRHQLLRTIPIEEFVTVLSGQPHMGLQDWRATTRERIGPRGQARVKRR